MKNPLVSEMLSRLGNIHDKKNDDYAASDPYENFDRSATIAQWFKHAIDVVFVVLIVTKMARLATLLNKEGPPNNESIEDSFDDLAMYCILWASKRKSMKTGGKTIPIKGDSLPSALIDRVLNKR